MKVKQVLIGAAVAALAVGGALAPAVTASAVTPAGVSAFNASKLPADWYSSSTNPSSKTAPAGGEHTDSAQAFSCHLHANAPTSNGGHKAIGYGAYQQCTGTGIYNQQVCAELLGIDYYGGRTVRGPERCNYGSGPQTVSVQPTVSCPAGSAYEYVTEARVIDDTETGEHRGSAESAVTAGSELC